jgi:hypothetical protein
MIMCLNYIHVCVYAYIYSCRLTCLGMHESGQAYIYVCALNTYMRKKKKRKEGRKNVYSNTHTLVYIIHKHAFVYMHIREIHVHIQVHIHTHINIPMYLCDRHMSMDINVYKRTDTQTCTPVQTCIDASAARKNLLNMCASQTCITPAVARTCRQENGRACTYRHAHIHRFTHAFKHR